MSTNRRSPPTLIPSFPTDEAFDKDTRSNQRVSLNSTIIRKLKRENDPDGGETPTCKKKLFCLGDEGGNEGGNEGFNDGFEPLTLSVSILNNFATVETNKDGSEGFVPLTLSASILNSFTTVETNKGGTEGTLGLNDSILTEDSTGTVILSESFLNEFSTVELDEDFNPVESTGSSSSPQRDHISSSSSTAVIKD